MMPFSVLRMCGLSIFNWLLLAGLIFCAWQAVEEYRRNTSQVAAKVKDDGSANASQQISGVVEPPAPPSDDDEFRVVSGPPGLSQLFYLLAAATSLLTLWNFAGSLPLRLFLHNPQGASADPIKPNSTMLVDRPDGTRLHVQVFGRDRSPTLVLTHGWSLDSSAWDYTIRRLSTRYRVVTWDLPGLGASKGPGTADWRLEKMAEDLKVVVTATTPNGPVILAGHSIGGMITQTFCRLHPEALGATVVGIALIHTTYVNPVRTCFASGLATALEAPLITPLNHLIVGLAPYVWLSNLQSYLNGSLHVSTRLTSFSGKQTWQQLDHGARLAVKAWPGVIGRGNLAMQQFDGTKTLSEVEIPVLVISGEHDRMTLPSASGRIEALLPSDRPFQLPSGHLGIWECADVFATALTEFAGQVFAHAKNKSAVVAVIPTPFEE